ncbi:MAG: hypothetical protein JSS02_20625 [Planctomycetes bacterium]|nr:hypothetical protein [Planctomycetota bacterium]
MSAKVPESALFVYVTCQVGAEPALKNEVARVCPALRFAFSRPGFLTFKLAPHASLPENWSDRLVFARAAGQCLGKVQGTTPENRARTVWELLTPVPATELHVWPRDRYTPGYRDYEPGLTAESQEIERFLLSQRPAVSTESAPAEVQESPAGLRPAGAADGTNPSVSETPLVADVIVVEPEEWWVGCHKLQTRVSRLPGGLSTAQLPETAVSRAWLKMEEAVNWSAFPLEAGQTVVEIGSAPGGASQYLLSRGLKVIGVDPAEMAPAVLADPQFRHIRKRSKEVPRSEFIGVDWLTCDVNLPPNYTLDTVKAIVAHPGVRFKGLLLTLKLVEWSLADEIPKFLSRIRSWGFRDVTARQLHHNRQEICVAATGFKAPKPHPPSGAGARRPSASKSKTRSTGKPGSRPGKPRAGRPRPAKPKPQD